MALTVSGAGDPPHSEAHAVVASRSRIKQNTQEGETKTRRWQDQEGTRSASPSAHKLAEFRASQEASTV